MCFLPTVSGCLLALFLIFFPCMDPLLNVFPYLAVKLVSVPITTQLQSFSCVDFSSRLTWWLSGFVYEYLFILLCSRWRWVTAQLLQSEDSCLSICCGSCMHPVKMAAPVSPPLASSPFLGEGKAPPGLLWFKIFAVLWFCSPWNFVNIFHSHFFSFSRVSRFYHVHTGAPSVNGDAQTCELIKSQNNWKRPRIAKAMAWKPDWGREYFPVNSI